MHAWLRLCVPVPWSFTGGLDHGDPWVSPAEESRGGAREAASERNSSGVVTLWGGLGTRLTGGGWGHGQISAVIANLHYIPTKFNILEHQIEQSFLAGSPRNSHRRPMSPCGRNTGLAFESAAVDFMAETTISLTGTWLLPRARQGRGVAPRITWKGPKWCGVEYALTADAGAAFWRRYQHRRGRRSAIPGGAERRPELRRQGGGLIASPWPTVWCALW